MSYRKYFCGVDGKWYDSYSDIPDYGSIKCYEASGRQVNLVGTTADIPSKCPMDVAPMSTAIAGTNTYIFNGISWTSTK